MAVVPAHTGGRYSDVKKIIGKTILMPRQAEIENTLIVFSDPQQLIEIYADDPASYKQHLKILNPHNYTIKFMISSCVNTYRISDSSGYISPSHFADLIIQPKDISAAIFDQVDKIRINVQSHGPQIKCGCKDIGIVIKSTKPNIPPAPLEAENFQQLEADHQTRQNVPQGPLHLLRSHSSKLLYFSFIVGLVGILLIPNAGENTAWPDILLMIRPTCECKIFASFTLGALLTYLLCKHL